MINKIYKTIHNKYSALFKFVFFLRYLFAVFFISAVLFLSIPYFFDFKKKDSFIKNYLFKSYGLKLGKYDDIKYNALPTPNLEIVDVSNYLRSNLIKLETDSLKIYPRLRNIYSFKDFSAKKIILNSNKIALEVSELKILNEYIIKLENKLTLNNLELKIFREDILLTNIKKINFSNYGYNKNIIRGEIFQKKFKTLIDDSFNKINLKLLATGVDIDIDFNENKEESILTGIIKAKVLNSKLKFDFKYDDKKINVYNSYFRSKDLSFNNKSLITYNPFFSLNSNYSIEDINIKLFKDLNLNKILGSKNIIKKINSFNIINYESKKFSKNLIDNLNLKINLSYGRLIYSKIFTISDSVFSCEGNSNLLKEFPILYFNCSILSKDKKKLLKKFSIERETKNEILDLKINGNLNLLNNKINFNEIKMKKDYEASKEDLKYFKDTFENILFDKNFISIFNYNKIAEFILEIS